MSSEVVTGLKFSVDCKNLISVGGDGSVTISHLFREHVDESNSNFVVGFFLFSSIILLRNAVVNFIRK